MTLTEEQIHRALDRIGGVLDAAKVKYRGLAVDDAGVCTAILELQMTPYKANKLREHLTGAGVTVKGLTYGVEQRDAEIRFRVGEQIVRINGD